MSHYRALSLAVAAATLLTSGSALAAGEDKPIKTLVTAVRYEKDALALKSLDGEAQGRYLLEDAWEAGTPEQRRDFVDLFHKLFSAIAFPKIRESFEHLETTLYEPAKVNGASAEVVSTIVILHPLKKQEIKVKYDLKKDGSGWRVVDVTVLGSGGASMLTDIRNDQIRPIMKDGGWDRLLTLMRQRHEQIAAAQKKKAN